MYVSKMIFLQVENIFSQMILCDILYLYQNILPAYNIILLRINISK